MLYPTVENYQNAVLIKIYDIKNENQIRSFWTQEPEMFLKMYTFMQANQIDIDIDSDCLDNDPYNDMVGEIKSILFSSGGTNTYNCIQVYVEVRDYR